MVGEIVPLQPFVVFHAERRAFAVGINEPAGNERRVRNRTVIRDSEGVMSDGVGDGSPYVDNPHATLKEAGGLCGEVVWDAYRTRFEGLVDMDAFLDAARER